MIKYVTDKYVSSFSWKMLSVDAVNSAWEPCFADYEGPTRAAFKSIQVTDVTWCLDELTPEGKVAYFESPLFNREQINARLVLRDQPNGPVGCGLELPAAQFDLRCEEVRVLTPDQDFRVVLRGQTARPACSFPEVPVAQFGVGFASRSIRCRECRSLNSVWGVPVAQFDVGSARRSIRSREFQLHNSV